MFEERPGLVSSLPAGMARLASASPPIYTAAMQNRAIKQSSDDDRRMPGQAAAGRAFALFLVLAVAIAAVVFGVFAVVTVVAVSLSRSLFAVDVFWFQHVAAVAAAATAVAMTGCGWHIAWDETVEAARITTEEEPF